MGHPVLLKLFLNNRRGDPPAYNTVVSNSAHRTAPTAPVESPPPPVDPPVVQESPARDGQLQQGPRRAHSASEVEQISEL